MPLWTINNFCEPLYFIGRAHNTMGHEDNAYPPDVRARGIDECVLTFAEVIKVLHPYIKDTLYYSQLCAELLGGSEE